MPEVDVKQLADDLKKASDEVKASNETIKKTVDTALTEFKGLGDITADTKARFDKLFGDFNSLTEKHVALEQKFVTIIDHDGEREKKAPKSLGELVVDDAGVKEMTSSFKGSRSVRISHKDLMSVTGTWGVTASTTNSLVGADRQVGMLMIPERQFTIRDLIAPGQTSSNMIEYAQETGFTNNARVVSEGATKPKSEITFNLKSAPVRTLAHIFKGSRQILDDAPALRSYIDARARYGLRFAEEEEILAGDGTGQHLHGIIPQAAAYSASFTPALVTPIDTIRLAMLQGMLAEFPPTGIVLNPIDWARIQLVKDTSGRYIIGNPVSGNTALLWNLPVVETQAMDVDTFLTGAFRLGAQIFDRLDIEILLSTENSTDFEKNMVTIRAEERLALAVYRPEAFVYGDMGQVT